MTVQYSLAVRDARLDQIQTTIGPSPVLKIFAGNQPANCSDPDPNGLLATIQLPISWMSPASGGIAVKLGTWSSTVSATGIMSSWRIYSSGGTICGMQGNSRDMTPDPSTEFTAGDTLTVTNFTLAADNA